MSVATQLLAKLVDSPPAQGIEHYLRLGLGAELFKGPEEESCWTLISEFVLKYGVLPTRDRFMEAGLALPSSNPDPLDFYADKIKERWRYQTLKYGVLQIGEALNANLTHKAEQLLAETMTDLTRKTYRRRLADFAHEGKTILFNEFKKVKLQDESYGLRFGWPTLDAMAEGLMGGDVTTIVGRPGKGKTYCLFYSAAYGWIHQNKCPMVVSMEMNMIQSVQRLAAITGKKSITQIKKAELSTKAELELAERMEGFKDRNHFWVMDGALAATMKDILFMARQLKPDSIWIDGAYMIRSLDHRSRWEKVTEIVEQAKSELAEGLDVPVTLSFQFNRKQKDGKDEKAELENIAYSDAVGQISSLVLALGLEDDENSVESLRHRKIEILKGRHGEVGKFTINWLFDDGPNYMDFSEVPKDMNQLNDNQYGVE